MRWLFKAIVILVIMVGLSGYAGYLMTGRSPWSSLQRLPKPDFHLPDLPDLPEVPRLSSAPGGGEVLPVYKWRNEEGVWHYTTDPPPEGVDYQIIDLDPDANMVKGWSTPATQQDRAAQSTEVSPPSPDGDAPALYTPAGIKKLINDARKTREQMEKRSREQQEALDKL